MLNLTLNTNEIKNAAGTEQEFGRLSTSERSAEYALLNEQFAYPHRISIKHTETGKGLELRRRSLIRVDKMVAGQVSASDPIKVSAYMVVDIPIGNMTTSVEVANVIANLLSFCATTGAATTVLFDGTGNGAQTLINGTL